MRRVAGSRRRGRCYMYRVQFTEDVELDRLEQNNHMYVYDHYHHHQPEATRSAREELVHHRSPIAHGLAGVRSP